MVVTLHACDLATDYAMEKAVGWGAKVILSVPCCQHELNRQIENPLMKPVFGYGLIKERMAALYTDAIRAQVLEYRGYRTQILEFIDMEHTPKNILIRAVRQGNDAVISKRHGRRPAQNLESFWNFSRQIRRSYGFLRRNLEQENVQEQMNDAGKKGRTDRLYNADGLIKFVSPGLSILCCFHTLAYMGGNRILLKKRHGIPQ